MTWTARGVCAKYAPQRYKSSTTMQQLGAHVDYSRRQRCSSRSRSPRREDWDRKEGREEARESRRGDNSNESRGDNSNESRDEPCDLVPLRDHDAVYLRSSCGSAATRKVADVSGAELKLKIQRDRSSSHNLSSSTAPDTSTIVRSDDRGTRNSESYALEVHGSGKQRRAARDFIELVLQQRSGRGGPSGRSAPSTPFTPSAPSAPSTPSTLASTRHSSAPHLYPPYLHPP